jgi:hypothetical protein
MIIRHAGIAKKTAMTEMFRDENKMDEVVFMFMCHVNIIDMSCLIMIWIISGNSNLYLEYCKVIGIKFVIKTASKDQ